MRTMRAVVLSVRGGVPSGLVSSETAYVLASSAVALATILTWPGAGGHCLAPWLGVVPALG